MERGNREKVDQPDTSRTLWQSVLVTDRPCPPQLYVHLSPGSYYGHWCKLGAGGVPKSEFIVHEGAKLNTKTAEFKSF